ncbi:MAG TPA: sugar transferase [Bryobacteraceae bacterium]|nr:sugar transferase [Bryobacteraceae bacterium]
MIRLFKVSIPSAIVALIVSEAILIFSCYLLAVYVTVDAAPDIYLLDDNGLWGILLITLLILIVMYFVDLYEDYRSRSQIALVQQYCLVIGVAFLVQALLNYGRWNTLVLPKWTMVYGSVGALVVLPLWRLTFTTVLLKAVGARRLLFLGSSRAVQDIIQRIFERPELGLAAVGYLDNDPSGPLELCAATRLGSVADLDTVVSEEKPDAIVVGMTERRQNLPVERLLELRLSGIHVEEASTTYEAVFGRVSTRDLRPSQLIFSAELGPRGQSITIQSAYSFAMALLVLVPALPVMLIVAILVRLSSPGPILLRQQRVGFNGAPFTIYKFRSMNANAEAKTGAIWAAKDDPRITPLGRWLRKLRLDELPQLFNVIRGEMSVVGPRPERPEFVAVLQEKIPYYRQRHCVKPGITGWAQINHKYGDTIEDTMIKLEYDLYYIKHLAWSLDAYIIFHTAKTMLFGRGAQ